MTTQTHAVKETWSTGGFYKEFHVECRCGKRLMHWNKKALSEMFKEHKEREQNK